MIETKYTLIGVEDEFCRRQGIHKSFLSSGELFSECFYVDDKIHGVYQQWCPDGSLRSKTNYVKGVRHGMDKFDSLDFKKNRYYIDGLTEGESVVVK